VLHVLTNAKDEAGKFVIAIYGVAFWAYITLSVFYCGDSSEIYKAFDVCK